MSYFLFCFLDIINSSLAGLIPCSIIFRILFVLILKSGHIVYLESILLPKIDYF